MSAKDLDLLPFKNGAELSLVLKAGKDGKYRIVGQIGGAIVVNAERVTGYGSAVRELRAMAGMTVDQVENEMARIRAQR